MSLAIDFLGVPLKNPVFTASGCFGYGKEGNELWDISQLGGILTKGTSLARWSGNPLPRLAETAQGLLNAIGLENPGSEYVCREYLPFLQEKGIAVFINVVGKTIEEYEAVVERFEQEEAVHGYEINISCPNVKEGGISFGKDRASAKHITSILRGHTKRPLIVKLSPNVTDIVDMAMACAEAGADGLSLINTYVGMAIDLRTRQPILGNVQGGLSGPAIKPLALRAVYDVSQRVPLPIIAHGGIASWQDAVEYLLAGATAIAVGTQIFVDPYAPLRIIEGLQTYMQKEGILSPAELIGQAHPTFAPKRR